MSTHRIHSIVATVAAVGVAVTGFGGVLEDAVAQPDSVETQARFHRQGPPGKSAWHRHLRPLQVPRDEPYLSRPVRCGPPSKRLHCSLAAEAADELRPTEAAETEQGRRWHRGPPGRFPHTR